MTFPATRRAIVFLLLKALFLGIIALFLASMVGALVLSLFTIYAQGADYVGIVFPALFYGLLMGPVIAWPVTLFVLPVAWLVMGDHLPAKVIWLTLIGAVAGAACIYLLVGADPEPTYIDMAALAAGFFGGAASGTLFGLIRRSTAHHLPRY